MQYSIFDKLQVVYVYVLLCHVTDVHQSECGFVLTICTTAYQLTSFTQLVAKINYGYLPIIICVRIFEPHVYILVCDMLNCEVCGNFSNGVASLTHPDTLACIAIAHSLPILRCLSINLIVYIAMHMPSFHCHSPDLSSLTAWCIYYPD